MNKKLLFIVNPKAGRQTIKPHMWSICETFADAGYDTDVHLTAGRGDASECAALNAEKYDLIVCCGGDGTLNETVNGLMQVENPPPLGYITAGTVNDVGYSLNLSFSPPQAAQTVVGGELFNWDIGRFCGERYFCYVAAFGLFTDVTYETPQEQKNLWGRLAYLFEGGKRLGTIPKYHTVIDCDGVQYEGDYMLGMVSNTLSVGGFRTIYGDLPDLSDGLFELALVKPPRTASELSHIAGIMLQLESADRVDSPFLQVISGKKMSFRFDTPVRWTLDGEFGGERDTAQVENLQQKLKVMTRGKR